MNEQILHQVLENNNRKIQIAPPWRCLKCNAMASRLACYTEFQNPTAITKPLDTYAPHIWYLLDLPCSHPPRVARLGDAITPLIFPYDSAPPHRSRDRQAADEQEAIQLVREALAAIAAAHGPDPHSDPAATIVWSLVAGAISPDEAIEAIRELVQAGILAALAETQPDFVFSEAENVA